MKNHEKKRKNMFSFSWRDLAVTLFLLCAVTALSFFLHLLDDSDVYVPMLFILDVFLISRYTQGYLFGTISSVIGVFLVNFIFTYPYFAFNFTISGYPLTFISMLVTSLMTSALTTRIKHQERIQMEAEREKLRGNLLRAVSHDLRTPLTSILGTTSALLENDDKLSAEQRHELLLESHDEAEWLIRMVENLLSVTRMNGGEAKLNKSPEAAEEIIGEAVHNFNKRFPDVKIIVAVPEELLIVPMDALLIEQVIINLLENAVLHGGVKTGISISAGSFDGNAVFMVEDNGTGIPAERLEHLFDGYLSNTDETDGDSKRNMGIGLSVCMSIVKAHGGIMTGANKAGGGAVFRFALPLEG